MHYLLEKKKKKKKKKERKATNQKCLTFLYIYISILFLL